MHSEQAQPQVEQLLAERANAKAYGQTDRVASIDKSLAAIGYAAHKRAAAAEEAGKPEEARRTAPLGRTTRADARGSKA